MPQPLVLMSLKDASSVAQIVCVGRHRDDKLISLIARVRTYNVQVSSIRVFGWARRNEKGPRLSNQTNGPARFRMPGR